tara:strand:+ start:289 stop:480 length:192 start_codon:yes stop_codon:yes gene_type:complete
LGQIGSGAQAKNTRKPVSKIKVKTLYDQKNLLQKCFANEDSQDNIQGSGVLSMKGKTNRFETE